MKAATDGVTITRDICRETSAYFTDQAINRDI
jgi:hypothetical protein